jgi:hypothetical protein
VRGFVLRLAVAVACIAIGSSGFAQGVRSRDRTFEASEVLAADLRRARLHSGPFYLLSDIQFSDLGYESQFFFPTSEQGGGLTFVVSAPQKLYFVPARKTIYSVTVVPEYAFFNRNGNGNSPWSYLVRGDAHFLLNHIYINAFALQSNRLQALSGEINRIVTQRDETAGVTGEGRYSTKTRVFYTFAARRTTYPRSRYQPSDLISDVPNIRGNIFELDHRERNARLSLLHHTFPLTSLTLAAEANKYTFPNSSERDATRRYVAPGFQFDSGRTTIKGEAGPAVLHFSTPGPSPDFHGVVGNFAVGHRISAKTNMTLAADRDVDFSIAEGERYYVGDRALFALDHQATRRLSLRFSSTVGRDVYPIATLNPANAQLARRHDEFSFTAVGWRYTLRHIKGGFDIGYYQRRSNFEIDEQNGIRLAIALSLSP